MATFQEKLGQFFSRSSTKNKAESQIGTEVTAGGTGFGVGGIGSYSTAGYSGWTDDGETNPKLKGFLRYKTYTNMFYNNQVVSAAVLQFIKYISNSQYVIRIANLPEDVSDAVKKQAEENQRFIEEMLFRDCETAFRFIVEQIAMALMYGFAILEWSGTMRGDGKYTLNKVESRPQATIWGYEWSAKGEVVNIMQRGIMPPTNTNVKTIVEWVKARKIPRWKCVHVVNKLFSKSIEGDGYFRYIVEETENLQRMLEVAAFSFKRDLRGIVHIYAPLEEIQKAAEKKVLQSGTDLTEEERKDGKTIQEKIDSLVEKEKRKLLAPAIKFAERIRKNDHGAFIIEDSSVYESVTMDGSRIGNTRKWETKFMEASQGDNKAINESIEQSEFRILSTFGLEGNVLGRAGDRGSNALSVDKSGKFEHLVDSAVKMVLESIQKDIINKFAAINMMDPDLVPTIQAEVVQKPDPTRSVDIFQRLAQSGMPVLPNDPAINHIRAQAGFPVMTEDMIKQAVEEKEQDREMQQQSMEMKAEQKKESKNDAGGN